MRNVRLFNWGFTWKKTRLFVSCRAVTFEIFLRHYNGLINTDEPWHFLCYHLVGKKQGTVFTENVKVHCFFVEYTLRGILRLETECDFRFG